MSAAPIPEGRARALRREGGVWIAYGSLAWVVYCLFMALVGIGFLAGSPADRMPTLQWIGLAFVGPVLCACAASALLAGGLTSFSAGAGALVVSGESGPVPAMDAGIEGRMRASYVLLTAYAVLAGITFVLLLPLVSYPSPSFMTAESALGLATDAWIVSAVLLALAALFLAQSFGRLLQKMMGVLPAAEWGIVAYAVLNLVGVLLAEAGALRVAAGGGLGLFVVGGVVTFGLAPAVGTASFVRLFLRTPLRPPERP